MSDVEKALLSLLSNWGYKNITPNTELWYDLRISDDDACELLGLIQKAYDTKFNDFEFRALQFAWVNPPDQEKRQTIFIVWRGLPPVNHNPCVDWWPADQPTHWRKIKALGG